MTTTPLRLTSRLRVYEPEHFVVYLVYPVYINNPFKMIKTKRRNFIKTVTGAGIALSFPSLTFGAEKTRDKWGELLPQKTFGSTGEKVTLLGLGGFHVGRMEDDKAQETIEMAMSSGVRFFDTAESYVDGEAERKYGKFLSPTYRDEVFLMTKTRARNRKTAEEHLKGSLERMKTDRLDLWLMHAINSEEDAEERLNNGVLDYMLEMKAKGIVRHVGFSGHTTTKGHLKLLLLTDELEACMLPINAIDWGYDSFIENVLPVLQKKKMGVIAMKTLAGGSFFGRGFDGRGARRSGPDSRKPRPGRPGTCR